VAVDATRAKRSVLLAAGLGAVLREGSGIAVRPLLNAPDLSGVPTLYERLVLRVPLPEVPGASAYRVQIAADPRMRELLRSETVRGGTAKIAGLDDGDYVLAVRPIDADGVTGHESSVPIRLHARPEPPLAQAPADGAKVALPSVELLCTEMPDTHRYHLQVSRSADFGVLAAEVSDLTLCRHEFDGLHEGEYHWRAARLAKNSRGELVHGPFGDASRFIAVRRPRVPEPQVEAGDTLSLHWGAEPGVVRFDIEVAEDLAFSRGVQTLSTEHPRVRLDVPPCGSRFVRLQAADADGFVSGFSAPRRVTAEPALCTGDGQPVRSTGGDVVGVQP
jgi:hypothetical protein